MERFAQPVRFDADPYSPDAAAQWTHWYRTFSHFIQCIESHNPNKLELLINYLSPTVYQSVSLCPTYEDAVQTLKSLYAPSKSEIFARHLLSTCRQENDQSLDQYIQKLRALASDCNYEAVTSDLRRDEAIRDSFITGLSSNQIRQRLLEHRTLTLAEAVEKAKAFEMAYKQSLSYQTLLAPKVCSLPSTKPQPEETVAAASPAIACPVGRSESKCFFCGNLRHQRTVCPAREAICRHCGKKGHFQKVCRSAIARKPVASTNESFLAALTIAAAPSSLKSATCQVFVNGIALSALIDTGSSESYVCQSVAQKHKWTIHNSRSKISMANTDFSSETVGHCFVQIRFKGFFYDHMKLSILPNLRADMIWT